MTLARQLYQHTVCLNHVPWVLSAQGGLLPSKADASALSPVPAEQGVDL